MSPTDTIRSSAARNFADLDTDGDGVLTKRDYLALAEQRLARAGVSAAAPEGEAVLDAYLSAWHTHITAMDIDDDGEITEDEYIQSFENLVATGALAAVLEPISRATFNLADRDRVGSLGVEEFRSLWSTLDIDLGAVFAQADADGDGRISYAEYAAVRRRLLLGQL